MSKAVTKEAEAEDLPAVFPPLPSGTRNYLTPGGHARLKDEPNHLSRVERPKVVEDVSWAASNGEREQFRIRHLPDPFQDQHHGSEEQDEHM